MKKRDWENHILDIKVSCAAMQGSIKAIHDNQEREIERVDDVVKAVVKNKVAIAEGRAGLRVLRWVIGLSFSTLGAIFILYKLLG